jgi:branched-chain amino acid transport system substrate-binding protein
LHGQIACQGGIFAVLLLAGATACTGHGGMGTFGNAGELPIALNVPLTGAGAPFGVPPKCAWEVVTEEYNRAGGLEVGSKRYPIKLVVDDNKWDPTVTRSAIEKEVYKDKVAVVKTVGDPGDPIIVPVTEDAGVLLIDSTGNKQFLKEPYRFVVGTWPSPNLIGKPFSTFCSSRNRRSRAPTTSPSISSSTAITQRGHSSRSRGSALSGRATLFTNQAPSTSHPLWHPPFKHPDVIVLGSLGGDAPAIVSTLRQLGYHGVIASDVASQSLENVVKGEGANAADGMYQAELSTYPGSKELENYRRAYESKCSGDWDAAQGVLFWTEAKFTLEAIKNSGAIDKPDAILKAMAHTTVETPFVAGSACGIVAIMNS